MRVNLLQRLSNWILNKYGKSNASVPQYLSGKGRLNEG